MLHKVITEALNLPEPSYVKYMSLTCPIVSLTCKNNELSKTTVIVSTSMNLSKLQELFHYTEITDIIKHCRKTLEKINLKTNITIFIRSEIAEITIQTL